VVNNLTAFQRPTQFPLHDDAMQMPAEILDVRLAFTAVALLFAPDLSALPSNLGAVLLAMIEAVKSLAPHLAVALSPLLAYRGEHLTAANAGPRFRIG
jgi:hypothetical protein